MNLTGVAHPAKRFVKDQKRNRYQRDGVYQRCQNPGAMISVRLGRTGRAGLQIYRKQRQHQREKIGKVVSRLGEQCQGVRPDASDDQKHDIGERYD